MSAYDGEVTLEGGQGTRVTTDGHVIRRAARQLLGFAVEAAGAPPVVVGVGSRDGFATVVMESRHPTRSPQQLHALLEPFDGGAGAPPYDLRLFVCRALLTALGGDVGATGDEQVMKLILRVPLPGRG